MGQPIAPDYNARHDERRLSSHRREFHEMVLRFADACDLDIGQLGRRLMF
jgi:hypothetical protein